MAKGDWVALVKSADLDAAVAQLARGAVVERSGPAAAQAMGEAWPAEKRLQARRPPLDLAAIEERCKTTHKNGTMYYKPPVLRVHQGELDIQHSWEKTASADEALEAWRHAVSEFDRLIGHIAQPAAAVITRVELLVEPPVGAGDLSYFLNGEQPYAGDDVVDEWRKDVIRDIYPAHPFSTFDTCGTYGDTPAMHFQRKLNDWCEEDARDEICSMQTEIWDDWAHLLFELVPKHHAYVTNHKGESFFHLALKQGKSRKMRDHVETTAGWMWRYVIESGTYPELAEKCRAAVEKREHAAAKEKKRKREA